MKILCLFAVCLLNGLTATRHANAEYDPEKLAEAAGAYVIANDMMEKLSKSKCGYIVKKPYSVQSALNEILPYFNRQDKEEVLSFIKSPKFQRDQAENEEFMEDFLRTGKRDGLDEKTLCGMLSTHIVFAHESATQKWRHAKKYYAR